MRTYCACDGKFAVWLPPSNIANRSAHRQSTCARESARVCLYEKITCCEHIILFRCCEPHICQYVIGLRESDQWWMYFSCMSGATAVALLVSIQDEVQSMSMPDIWQSAQAHYKSASSEEPSLIRIRLSWPRLRRGLLRLDIFASICEYTVVQSGHTHSFSCLSIVARVSSDNAQATAKFLLILSRGCPPTLARIHSVYSLSV